VLNVRLFALNLVVWLRSLLPNVFLKSVVNELVAQVSCGGLCATIILLKLKNIVGYSIRLESKQSSRTRLLFCTTGVLLRRLQVTHFFVWLIDHLFRLIQPPLLLSIVGWYVERHFSYHCRRDSWAYIGVRFSIVYSSRFVASSSRLEIGVDECDAGSVDICQLSLAGQ
jgi:hypothetical protein